MVYLTSCQRLVWNTTAFFWAISGFLCCIFGQYIFALIASCNFYITVNELRLQQSIVKYGQIKIIVPLEYSDLKTPFEKTMYLLFIGIWNIYINHQFKKKKCRSTPSRLKNPLASWWLIMEPCNNTLLSLPVFMNTSCWLFWFVQQ